jgi:hypothetical protein
MGDDEKKRADDVGVVGYVCEDGIATPVFRSEGYRGKTYPTPAEAKAHGPMTRRSSARPTVVLPALPPEEPVEDDEEDPVNKKTETSQPAVPAADPAPTKKAGGGSAGDRVAAFLATDRWQAAKAEKGMRGVYAAYEAWANEQAQKPMAWNTFQSQAYRLLKK